MENKELSEEICEEYQQNMKRYINSIIPNTSYIIQVSKCCGYCELLFIFKNSTLIDLYKYVSQQFSCNNIKRLFIKNEKTKTTRTIPITEEITMRQFVVKVNMGGDEIKGMLSPIYPFPNPVVYRIYLDDGHCDCDSKENHIC
jgi:hypothetical protein